MSAADWAVLGGAFLGGAIPWLEAIVVIPAGILAGAPPLLVVLAAVVGNLITVWLAAYFGEQIRNWWLRRRARGRATPDPDTALAVPEKKQARQQRIDRVMKKWGLPGLAILGPLGLGTQLSALAAVAMGVRARAAFAWVGLATILWATVAAVLTTLGVSAFGPGAAS